MENFKITELFLYFHNSSKYETNKKNFHWKIGKIHCKAQIINQSVQVQIKQINIYGKN